MKLKDVEKKALRMARIIHNNFEQSDIGIIGGTVRKETSEGNDFIRMSDRCLISREGLCNLNRHRDLQPLLLDEYDISYRLSVETLIKKFPYISYASGLAIANPVVRLLMYNIAIDDVYDCTLNDLKDKPRLPVVNWVESETVSEMYSISLEDFRAQEKKPNWCLRLSDMAEECDYFARSKDGYYVKLSSDKIAQYLSPTMSSYAHGIEWDIDFAILTVTANPLNPKKKIVAAGGNHWLGTLAANALINLVKKIPQKGISFRNTMESMAWLGEVVEKEELENFQAIFRVTDDFTLDGNHEINVYVTGVFSLPT
ncbi:MAG: hypothetical protein KAI71_00220 [Candidatus Pacebacteria bacterium]|nr:hypothetical protein [Candidatus Paceibacterota bacterium]